MTGVIKKLYKYLNDTSGVNAVIFALVLPAMMAAGGLAVDLANAYNVKNKLGQALDKAALATANSLGTQDELTEIAKKFFYANFDDDGLGTAATPIVTFTETTVSVSASASVDMLFMRVFGKDSLTVNGETEVTRELSGIEVVLVLDVTGSMAGSNITALKSASTDFLNIMFDRITDEELLKIGIVPYSSSVNVGPYGFGLDMDGAYYGSAFVDRPDSDEFKTPEDIEYDTSSNYDWHGCVLAEDYPADTEDDTTSGFEMYRYARECTRTRRGRCERYRSDPNYNCTSATVVPLTSDQVKLQSTIDNLPTGGHTYGNFGMVWGWRLISPEEPFVEGTAYDDPKWKKAVIMMTDGANTMHNWYSAYGKTSSHDISPNDLNERFEETCENMKENDILIYTITFQSGVGDSTKAYYERCATSPTMYEHAPDDDRLISIFQGIANQLSKLHISK